MKLMLTSTPLLLNLIEPIALSQVIGPNENTKEQTSRITLTPCSEYLSPFLAYDSAAMTRFSHPVHLLDGSCEVAVGIGHTTFRS